MLALAAFCAILAVSSSAETRSFSKESASLWALFARSKAFPAATFALLEVTTAFPEASFAIPAALAAASAESFAAPVSFSSKSTSWLLASRNCVWMSPDFRSTCNSPEMPTTTAATLRISNINTRAEGFLGATPPRVLARFQSLLSSRYACCTKYSSPAQPTMTNTVQAYSHHSSLESCCSKPPINDRSADSFIDRFHCNSIRAAKIQLIAVIVISFAAFLYALGILLKETLER